ncbi:MAG: DNA replication protein [Rhodospirillales bacterium]|nr:DNA replication protein [Rhodospirillales bacterium]
MSDPPQLTLDFDHRPSLAGDDFLVAPNNDEAVSWLDRWPHWPGPVLAIHGPVGCGKTHLASVFAALSGARVISAADLQLGADPLDILGAAPAFVIEDAEAAAAGGEEDFLHLFNVIAETGRHLLLTSKTPPSRWPLGLPDLRSRLNSVLAVEIGAPGDALIVAVLVKLFSDRQLRVDDEVIRYLSTRMDRSFEAARSLVDRIDRHALAAQRNITVPLVRQVLESEDKS